MVKTTTKWLDSSRRLMLRVLPVDYLEKAEPKIALPDYCGGVVVELTELLAARVPSTVPMLLGEPDVSVPPGGLRFASNALLCCSKSWLRAPAFSS